VSLILALSSHGIDQTIFDIANVLEVPVLIAALAALAAVIIETGTYVVEWSHRRGRRFEQIDAASTRSAQALATGDRSAALVAAQPISRSPAMAETVTFIVNNAGLPGADNRLNKALADFDFAAQRRLGPTRVLVRAGPAIGLMGTLIPLSPALTGLANGNVSELSHDLRVAFSVTVVGLLIGAVAYALSLSRDGMYGQDLSDLEYFAATVSEAAVAEQVSV
jgi:biopolymer transport protein ExbB/TolQ